MSGGSGASDGPPRRRPRDPGWSGTRVRRRPREPRPDGGRGAVRAGTGRRGRALDGALPPEARRRAGARHCPWSAPRSATRSGRCEGTRTGSLSFWRSFGRARGSPRWTGGSTSSRRDSPRAATHGVIRVGHAARSLARHDTPGRRKELARGFAYWAATHQTLPRKETWPAHLTPEQALAHVPRLPDDVRRTGSISQGLKLVATLPDFPGVISLVDAGAPESFVARPRRGLRARLPRGDDALGANDRAHPRRDRAGRRGPSRAARVRADGGASHGLRVAGGSGDLRGVWKAARRRPRSKRHARRERR